MKKFLCFAMIFVLAISLAACYSDVADPSNNPNDNPIDNPIVTDYTGYITRKPVAATDLSYEEFQTVRSKVNEVMLPYSADFIERFLQIEGAEHKNTICSPLTAYFAFSMAAEAARGITQQEILSVLHVSDTTALRECADMFYNASNKERAHENFVSQETVTNSLWLDPDYTYDQTTLDILAQRHHAFTFETSFKKNNAASNKAIGDFVYQESHKLLDLKFNFDFDTVCLLVSTMYVTDIWTGIDGLSFTKDTYNFQNYDGTTTTTKLLESVESYGKPLQTESYSAFPVSSTSNFNMYFVVPNDDCDIVDVMNANTVKDVLSANYQNYDNGAVCKTTVLFPEFTVDNNLSLTDTMKALGILKAFSSDADLTGLLPNDETYFGNVIQANKLRVDKNGFEGASVTIIPVCDESAPPMVTEYFTLTVDRSFGFILTDNCGIPLFSGIIFNI